ncbi:queuosine precursor transporter [Maricaulis sp.]|uniref:queuosine precursor transporter n=1 Tax=Maricaulis sp. TaxID=1486257 RepID=UPI001B11DC09|nr:queuosine precursor transporter [Maricaulis sp.]MBO6797738.1 queuosine precursor transporter [Maricaulis sp.]
MSNPLDPKTTRELAVNRKDFVLFFCIGLFMVSLVLAAITAVKIQSFHFGPLVVLVPAGSVAFGLTYLETDVISEVWGRSFALMTVYAGLVMRFVMFILIGYALGGEDVFPFIGIADSWAPERDAAFESVLGASMRINLAGVVAFGLSALSGVFIFHHLKHREKGKNRLWLRNNISTTVSQVLDSIVFVTVAFGGTMPLAAVASIVLGQVLVKVSVAFLDTPVVYLLRNIATDRKLFDFRG